MDSRKNNFLFDPIFSKRNFNIYFLYHISLLVRKTIFYIISLKKNFLISHEPEENLKGK